MVDGFTSSALFYNYIIDHYSQNYNFTIDYHIPEGKEHGLKSIMHLLTDSKKYDLIVLPDAGSNDIEEHRVLREMGYDIVCLDHHHVSDKSDSAIVVNNQSSEKYTNKMLSGVGVVYQFLRLLDDRHGWNDADKYLDLVALGETSDMMDMTTLENRFICDYGLSHLHSKFFKALVEKQSYSLGDGPLTQIGVAFYVTPLINALIRVGNDLEKERLFQAFITPDVEVKSTKRGETDKMETVCEQSVRNCINAKSKQNRFKEKAAELLDIQIIENCLDDNKVIILNADELDVPTTMTGLCAMEVSARYKKPVLLGRINKEGFFKGSGRGRDGSELQDLRQLLVNSGLMDFAEGHAQAFGLSIKTTNIEKLTEYCNKTLKNIDFNEGFYEVDFIVPGNYSKLNTLITTLDKGKHLYGQGNPEPIIAVENLSIPVNNIQIIGKNSDTLKFEYNGITYIKFKATKLIKEIKDKKSSLNITVIGRGNINNWGGVSKPQILIDEIEIKESSIYDF